MAYYGDSDSQETQEWQDAFDSVLQHMGTERAAFLLEKLYQQAISKHVPILAAKGVDDRRLQDLGQGHDLVMSPGDARAAQQGHGL